jgi:hypothetical protein
MSVVALIIISSTATYVHLSYYVADYIRQENATSSQSARLEKELETVRKERETIDKQIASLPAESIKGRVTLINKFDRRKKQIDAREEAILDKMNSTEETKVEDSTKKKEYVFLDYMSTSFGKSRQTIYNTLILLLVTVLDPLAILLTLSGTYIFASKTLHKKSDEDKEETCGIAWELNDLNGRLMDTEIEIKDMINKCVEYDTTLTDSIMTINDELAAIKVDLSTVHDCKTYEEMDLRLAGLGEGNTYLKAKLYATDRKVDILYQDLKSEIADLKITINSLSPAISIVEPPTHVIIEGDMDDVIEYVAKMEEPTVQEEIVDEVVEETVIEEEIPKVENKVDNEELIHEKLKKEKSWEYM